MTRRPVPRPRARRAAWQLAALLALLAAATSPWAHLLTSPAPPSRPASTGTVPPPPRPASSLDQQLRSSSPPTSSPAPPSPSTVPPSSPAAPAGLSGSQPFDVLPCAFPDVAGGRADLGRLARLWGEGPGTLGTYWREVSYGRIDLHGTLVHGWQVLPRPRAAYVHGGHVQFDQLLHDCDQVHLREPHAQPAAAAGIVVVANTPLGCCSVGSRVAEPTATGERVVPAVWLPSTTATSASVVAHEVGHAFGLPHSNNDDGDHDPYDDPWDVMSSPERWALPDGDLGWRPKGLLAQQLDVLGWLAPAQRWQPRARSSTEVELVPLEAPPGPGLRLVRVAVPGPGGRSVTLEVRERSGDWDGALPGRSVGDRTLVVATVDPRRPEPAHVVAALPGTGATWSQVAGQLSVTVVRRTPRGLLVRVTLG